MYRCESSAAAMIAMTAAYGVFRGFFEVNTHATLFDVVPAQYRSTSVGIFTVFAFLFGGLSGVVMGALSQRYGVRGFEIGFMLMGASYVVGRAAHDHLRVEENRTRCQRRIAHAL